MCQKSKTKYIEMLHHGFEGTVYLMYELMKGGKNMKHFSCSS